MRWDKLPSEMRVAATLTQQFNADVPDEVDAGSADELLPTDARTRCLRRTAPNVRALHLAQVLAGVDQ